MPRNVLQDHTDTHTCTHSHTHKLHYHHNVVGDYPDIKVETDPCDSNAESAAITAPTIACSAFHPDAGYLQITRVESLFCDKQNADRDRSTVQKRMKKPRKRRGAGGSETPSQRLRRLQKQAEYAAQRRQTETPQQRADRLAQLSATVAKLRRKETPEQRAVRLKRSAAYVAKRLAAETVEERRRRLSKMSEYQARRRKQS